MSALLQALVRLVALKRLGVLLFVLAATLCASTNASALQPAQTKTRIWGFDFANNNSSGLLSTATSGKHQGNRLAQSELASGCLLAAEGTTTLYRAVSEAELVDIGATGGFRGGAGSMGNKWFAESAKDASAWGKQFFKMDGQAFYTVRVQVPNSVAAQMWRTPMLDAIGPARSAEGAVIDLINGQGTIDALGANAVP